MDSLISDIVQVFTKQVGNTQITSQFGNQLSLKIANDGNKSIGYLFACIQKLLKVLPIEEYSAEQTTLEQIFNAFAKKSSNEIQTQPASSFTEESKNDDQELIQKITIN